MRCFLFALAQMTSIPQRVQIPMQCKLCILFKRACSFWQVGGHLFKIILNYVLMELSTSLVEQKLHFTVFAQEEKKWI